MFNYIGIVGAMEGEIKFLRDAITPPDRTGNRYIAGTLGPKTITVLRTGVGPEKTRRRLPELAADKEIQCVLSIGCAGALTPNLSVGDVILSERIIDGTGDGTAYSSFPNLLEAAQNSCKGNAFPFLTGPTVTMGEVAATPEAKEELANRYGAFAVDMESALVAAWAQECGLPMLAIRTICDTSTDTIPPELLSAGSSAGDGNRASILTGIAKRPKLLLEALRLRKNLVRSLETLEKVILTLLPGL